MNVLIVELDCPHGQVGRHAYDVDEIVGKKRDERWWAVT